MPVPVEVTEHTYGRDCLACVVTASPKSKEATTYRLHGRLPVCTLQRYSGRYVRFVLAHWEAFESAYLNTSPAAARNEREHLRREFATLPTRHACSCNPFHCVACAELAGACERCKQLPLRQRPNQCDACDRLKGQDVAVEIGRSGLVHAPMPDTTLLDIGRARAAGHTAPEKIARYLNEAA